MKMKNLRQRMIEDMKLRGLAPSTQKRYLDAIKALADVQTKINELMRCD